MRYLELEPSPPLRRYIRCYWFLSGSGPTDDAPAEPALPDGSPELIINLGDPFQAVSSDGRARLQPATMLVGQITGPFAVAPTGRIDLVAARLEPFGAAGLWDRVADLTDQWADGDDIPRAELANLRARLLPAKGTEDRAAILDHHLGRVMADAKQPDPRVPAAVRSIRTSHGAARSTVFPTASAPPPAASSDCLPRKSGSARSCWRGSLDFSGCFRPGTRIRRAWPESRRSADISTSRT